MDLTIRFLDYREQPSEILKQRDANSLIDYGREGTRDPKLLISRGVEGLKSSSYSNYSTLVIGNFDMTLLY